MWIVQFVNTAIILLIVNNRLNKGAIKTALSSTGTEEMAFNGKYHDFNTEWYEVVGMTIFTTAIINGLTPVGTGASVLIGYGKGLWDRGFKKDKKKTKTMLQEHYEKVYTGPTIQYDNRLS